MSTVATQLPRTRAEYLTWCKQTVAEQLESLRQTDRYYLIEYHRPPDIVRRAHPMEKIGSRKLVQPPDGVFFAFEDFDDNLNFGWSAWNTDKEKRPFVKADGLRRAIQRANGSPPKNVCDRLYPEYCEFIQRAILGCKEKQNYRNNAAL